jgi:general secretion pathway protein H
MLMVLVIVGALVSMVGLVSPVSPQRQARIEAAGLIQVLQAARESAVLEGREYGLQVQRDHYRLLRFDTGGWHQRGESRMLPADLAFDLRLGGQTLVLQGGAVQPQLLLLSNDEYSAFEIAIQVNGRRLIGVSGDGLNDPVMHEG